MSIESPINNNQNKLHEEYGHVEPYILDLVAKECDNKYFYLAFNNLKGGKEWEGHDEQTIQHTLETANLIYILCKEKGFSREETEEQILSALEHDLGKAYINKEVIKKNSPPNEGEWEEIKKHASYGTKITEEINPERKNIVSSVHRFGDNPYPEGEIKLSPEEERKARDLTITDCFQAIISKRSYKNRIIIEKPEDFYKYIEGRSIKELNAEDKKTIEILFNFYNNHCDKNTGEFNFRNYK